MSAVVVSNRTVLTGTALSKDVLTDKYVWLKPDGAGKENLVHNAFDNRKEAMPNVVRDCQEHVNAT